METKTTFTIRQENLLGEKNVYPKEIALFQFIKEKYNFGGEKGDNPVKESQVGQIVLFDLGQRVRINLDWTLHLQRVVIWQYLGLKMSGCVFRTIPATDSR